MCRITFTFALLFGSVLSIAAGADQAADTLSRGKSHLEKGDLVAAIAALSKAIELDRKSAEAHYQRALARRKKGRLRQRPC